MGSKWGAGRRAEWLSAWPPGGESGWGGGVDNGLRVLRSRICTECPCSPDIVPRPGRLNGHWLGNSAVLEPDPGPPSCPIFRPERASTAMWVHSTCESEKDLYPAVNSANTYSPQQSFCLLVYWNFWIWSPKMIVLKLRFYFSGDSKVWKVLLQNTFTCYIGT